ncbi:MAG TPA: hypothetical protein PLD54_02930 [Candidatus Levybacteria bacterium]|nr:hypothetical protein [Candidatus Levybacteria bacterium]
MDIERNRQLLYFTEERKRLAELYDPQAVINAMQAPIPILEKQFMELLSDENVISGALENTIARYSINTESPLAAAKAANYQVISTMMINVENLMSKIHSLNDPGGFMLLHDIRHGISMTTANMNGGIQVAEGVDIEIELARSARFMQEFAGESRIKTLSESNEIRKKVRAYGRILTQDPTGTTAIDMIGRDMRMDVKATQKGQSLISPIPDFAVKGVDLAQKGYKIFQPVAQELINNR